MRATNRRSRLIAAVAVTLTMAMPAAPATADSHVSVDVVQTFPGGSLEGVAVDKTGNVFASSTLTGELLKFAPGSSDYEVFGAIDGWPLGAPLGAGFLGLAVDAQGNVYGAAQWGPSTGVYQFDRKTGEATRIPGTENMSFPNAIAFDKRGNMYITDSNSTGVFNPVPPGHVPMGAIWRVDKNGTATKWFESEVLGGTGLAGLATPVGANGIAYRQGVLTVANVEAFALYTVPIEGDGSPGGIDLRAGFGATDWPVLAGPLGPVPALPDGIALDVHGGIYVASVAQNAVFRVNTDNSVDLLYYDDVGATLNFPSSVAFGTGSGFNETLYVVNLGAAFNPFGPTNLVAIDVGVPGMPLP